MHRGRVRQAGAVVWLIAIGCGEAPPSPSPSPPTTPASQFWLSGHVSDTAYRPIGGAGVVVSGGSRAATTTTTDEAGRFSMPGTFSGQVAVTASKEGYLSQTRSYPFPGAPTHPVEGVSFAFQLELLGPTANVAGEYTLTLTADSACTGLPPETRRRAYAVTVVQPTWSRFHFPVSLNEGRFLSGRSRASMSVAGDFARFVIAVSINGQSDSNAGIVEQIGDAAYVAIDAGAEGTFGASGMTTSLSGSFEYCPGEAAIIGEQYQCLANVPVSCSSPHHQLTLIRR